MSEMAPNSLRRRLLVWLVGILSAIWLTAMCLVLWNATGEVKEAYTGQVIHFARALATINAAGEIGVSPETDDSWRQGTNNYFVVVSRDGEEIYRSSNTPKEFAPSAQAETMEIDIGNWTLASRTTEDGRVTSTVGLYDGDITYYAWGMAAGVALPMFLGFAAIVAAVFLAVTHGLQPLTQLSHQILGRSSRQLEPVDVKKAPAELLPIINSLNGLFARLTVSLEKERRFIADASHELRTPLTAIKAQVQTIDRGSISPELEQTLGKVMQGLDRASRLVEQLLALARSEAEDSGRPMALVNIADVARNEVANVFPRALAGQVELSFQGNSAHVSGDPTEISVMIRNLVDNAVLYAGAGSSVIVSTGVNDGIAWVQVEDSGVGIPDNELRKVFDRFTRGACATGEGSGLGLSIVKAIADRYRGEVTLHRSPRLGGLCAKVTLPETPADQT